MVVIGGVVLVAMAGVIFYSVSDSAAESRSKLAGGTGMVAPEGLTPRLESFRDAWAASDLNQVRKLYDPAAKHRADQLASRIESRGWKGTLPELRAPRIYGSYKGRPGTYAEFSSKNGPLRTAWKKIENDWMLIQLYLPSR